MPDKAIDKELGATISKALKHSGDPQVNTFDVSGTVSPDGNTYLVFYDFWEFHMGVSSAKVALVAKGPKVLKYFPFTSTSTSAFLSAWCADSSCVAINLGNLIVYWSVADKKFALMAVAFTPSSLTVTEKRVVVRESKYRVDNKGYGYYADGPNGAMFQLSRLKWHDGPEIRDLDKACVGLRRKKADKIERE